MALPLHGLLMATVMMELTMLNVVMMVETVVDAMSIHNTAQNANALILMEVGMEQLAHKQQQQVLHTLSRTDLLSHYIGGIGLNGNKLK